MKYIQIHELTSYPASNLNRDDLGRPKTVKIGDSTRLRISSQSLKRAWRISDAMNEKFPVMGVRSRKLSETIEHCLMNGISLLDCISGNEVPTRNPVDEKVAKKYGKAIDDALRSQKSDDYNDKESSDDGSKAKKKQLFHYSDSELKAADNIMAQVAEGKEVDVKDLICSGPFSVDIAMFGRMVADDKEHSCEAAVQVAHSFTVHKAVVEEDYFTAVDDLNKDSDSGAGHLGETSFGAGLFYNYICIDFELLTRNLGSEDKAHEAVKALLEVSATVSPTGKQNTFASRAYSSFIMIEKGDKQPRSLASAFLRPIHGDDLLRESIEAIKKTQSNMNNAFGNCYDDCYIIDVQAGQGSISEAGAFLE